MNRFILLSVVALPMLLDASLKSAVLLMVAGVCALAMHRASAAARHVVWVAAVVALLLVPVLSVVLPRWHVLPQWAVVETQERTQETKGTEMTARTVPVAAVPILEMPTAPTEPVPALPSLPPFKSLPSFGSFPPAPPQPDPTNWVLPLWAAGCALLLLRLSASHFLLRRATSRCEAAPASLSQAFAAAASESELRQPVQLLVDHRRTIPVVWGIFRPCLLLPAESLDWDAEQLRSVLLHEIAHLRRRDPLVQCLMQLACALHWFNPLVWLAAWRLHVEREKACDDLVLARGVKPSAYAEHLLQIASQLTPVRWTAGCGLAMARKSSLEGRLMAVLSDRLNRTSTTRMLAAAAVFLAAAIAVPLAMLRAAEPEKAKPAETPPAVNADPKAPSTAATPIHKDARSLYEFWQSHARANGHIPGALIGQLAAGVKQFIRYNPTWETVPKLNEILPKLDATHDWKPADAIALLDEVAAVKDSPLSMASMLTTRHTIRQGEPLPKKFTDAPWGEAEPTGLRAAWVLEPDKAEHRFGDALRARLLVHNSGKVNVTLQVPTWHQGSITATDAKGAELEVSSVEWTTIATSVPVRLAPGEFIEINTPGVGFGPRAGMGPWAGPRVGSNVLKDVGADLTLTHSLVPLDGSEVGMSEDDPHVVGPGWWLAHIKARLSQELPLPADAAERTRLLDRTVRDLFATDPSDEETATFVADKTPDAFDSLVKRLAAREDVVSFSGKLPTVPVKFRVLAALPSVDEKARVVLGPGEYPIGGASTLKIVSRQVGDRHTNDAQIVFAALLETGQHAPNPHKLEVPDGWGTWAIVCRPSDGFLYLLHKGIVRKIDHSDPAKVTDTPANDLPAEFSDEVKRILDIYEISDAQQAEIFEKPAPPATTDLPKKKIDWSKSPDFEMQAADKLKDQPSAGAKLERAMLEGTWEGEKDGVKVEVQFQWISEHQQVRWNVQTPNAGISAQMSVVLEPDGSLAKFIFRKGVEFEATLGRLTLGEGGTMRLEIVPNPNPSATKYPAVEGLVLKKQAESESGQPVPKPEPKGGVQEPPKPTAAATPKLPPLPDEAYARPGFHCQQFREEDAKRPGGELMGGVSEPRTPAEFEKELILGLRTASDAQWRIAGTVKVGLVVRSNTKSDVKFAFSDMLDSGLSIVAIDEVGKEHQADVARTPFGFVKRQQMLLPGNSHVATVKEFTLRFDAEKRPVTEPHIASFHLPPGKYTLRCKWSDASPHDAHEGEWSGELVSGEHRFTLAAAVGPTAITTLQPATEQKLKWGESVKGLRMALAWPPTLGEPTMGAAQEFYLVVQNVSEAEVRFTTGTAAPNPRRLNLMRRLDTDKEAILSSRFVDDVPVAGDWLLQPRESALVRLIHTDDKTPDGQTFSAMKENIVSAQPQYSYTADMTIEKAPAGAWTGMMTTGETRGAADVIPTKHVDAQTLYKAWTTAARADGNIPGALIGRLGESVKTFIKINPTSETTPQLEKMLPRFDASHDWSRLDTVALLDELAALGSTPISMALDDENKGLIRPGTPLPPELATAPWGHAVSFAPVAYPHPTGLRVAWLLEPQAAEHRLGTPLKARVLIHNSGTIPVVFRTRSWHQLGHKATDAQGAEIKVDATQSTTRAVLHWYRLAPGEFIEVNGPGIGVGPAGNREDWQNARVGSWIEAKAGDDVTVTTAELPLMDWGDEKQLKMDGEMPFWRDKIVERLSRHLPLPADADSRLRLLHRVARELFGTSVSQEISDAFVADTKPTALASLAERLHHRPGLHAWAGSLPSAPTKFRVLPAAQPKAATLQPATEQKLDWSEPVNGLRLALAWPPSLGEPAAGAVADFLAVVQNVSDAPVRLYTKAESLDERWVDVRDDSGTLLRLSSKEASGVDVTLQPRQVVVFTLLPEGAKQADRATTGAMVASDVRQQPKLKLRAGLKIATAPVGAWSGKLTTPDTRAGLNVEAPANRKAQELLKIWIRHARHNGSVPGGFIARLGEHVKTFVKANAADASGAPFAKRMEPLLPRLDGSRDWPPAEATVLMNEIAAVSDGVLSVMLNEIAAGQVQHGLLWEKQLETAPWGESLPNGLRAACIVGQGVASRLSYIDWVGNAVTHGAPRDKAAPPAPGAEIPLGTSLGCRWLIHNAGKEPVVFRVRTWHHIEPTAKDSKGAAITMDSHTRLTVPSLVTFRLEPDRYIELPGPGLGLGKYGFHDFKQGDLATWMDAKAGDEVTLTPGPLPLQDWNESTAADGEPRWWLDFITSRLGYMTPLPVDAANRRKLLEQAMRDLFLQNVVPTEEETASFLADTSPQSLATLAERLFHRPGVHAWSGTLQSGPTKFRVLPADPKAPKPPDGPASTPP